jgi:hypothetical protein
MGINAITQMLVPPPKYSADRLVACRMGSLTKVRDLFIIERGTPGMSELDQESTLARMLINTDDAYGFPPFRYLAPAIVIGGTGYRELRRREEEILRGFLSQIRTRVIASDNFGWADTIPRLLQAEYGLDLPGLADQGSAAVIPAEAARVPGSAAPAGAPVPALSVSRNGFGPSDAHRVIDLRDLPQNLPHEWPRWAVASSGGGLG